MFKEHESYTVIEVPLAEHIYSVDINFEDIFLGLFDGDGAGILASAPTRIIGPSEATTSPDETWWTFLFCGQKWIVYNLESAFETLQN